MNSIRLANTLYPVSLTIMAIGFFVRLICAFL